MFGSIKKVRTFAPLSKGNTSEKKLWRGGRVVDCGGLENRCTARYPGFESLSLRKKSSLLGCSFSITGSCSFLVFVVI